MKALNLSFVVAGGIVIGLALSPTGQLLLPLAAVVLGIVIAVVNIYFIGALLFKAFSAHKGARLRQAYEVAIMDAAQGHQDA